jgi:hypothetical protein
VLIPNKNMKNFPFQGKGKRGNKFSKKKNHKPQQNPDKKARAE